MLKLFAIVPLGIGLSVIGFLWFTPFDQFGSPPLFFRVFGTFVALPFVFIGVAGLRASSLSSHEQLIQRARDMAESLSQADIVPPSPPQATSSAGYVCPSCNAPIGTGDDVSPHGDVKCSHCGRWFNVHSAS